MHPIHIPPGLVPDYFYNGSRSDVIEPGDVVKTRIIPNGRKGKLGEVTFHRCAENDERLLVSCRCGKTRSYFTRREIMDGTAFVFHDKCSK
jgi:hypothetical protein